MAAPHGSEHSELPALAATAAGHQPADLEGAPSTAVPAGELPTHRWLSLPVVDAVGPVLGKHVRRTYHVRTYVPAVCSCVLGHCDCSSPSTSPSVLQPQGQGQPAQVADDGKGAVPDGWGEGTQLISAACAVHLPTCSCVRTFICTHPCASSDRERL